MKPIVSFCFLLVMVLFLRPIYAQTSPKTSIRADTMELNYQQAKALLLKENLGILSAFYEISKSEAEALQSKQWTNPYLVWNQDMYSVEGNDYFNFTRQYLFQVQQTFSVAGKHTNTVKLARINVEMNKIMLEDVIRSLFFELSEKYMMLHTLQRKQTLYETVITNFDKVVTGAEQQLRVGSMAGNEVIRLRSESIALQTQALQNKNDIEETMSEIRQLLNLKDNQIIKTVDRANSVEFSQSFDDLTVLAFENRPDYRLAKKGIEQKERNLKLQRSRSMPDIILGYQPSDKGSNYVRTYSGMTMEMPLPFFDRNQGGIQSAKVQIDQARVQKEQKENQVLNEVLSAYNQLTQTREGLLKYNQDFLNKIEELIRNANANYNRRNISLLEYIDLLRIYVQTETQMIDLHYEYQKAINRINFAVGLSVIE
jgi:outer membrane protein, heavy metal efflux system